jgi:hypothetical protein
MDDPDVRYARSGEVEIASPRSGFIARSSLPGARCGRHRPRAGSGIDFEDRGLHELKGLDEPRRLFAVRGEA